MKFTIEVDPEERPDAVGEVLRGQFFQEDHAEGEVGCYTSFDWQEGVEELPLVHVETEEVVHHELEPGMVWTRGQKDGIECRWHWDGDGTLAFKLPTGKWLINSDCKKDHGWSLVDDINDYQEGM